MSEMTRMADNILTRLWNSYKKEHPNAKAPPQSLKDKADDLAGDKKKEEKKPAPKAKDGIKQEHDEDGPKGMSDTIKALAGKGKALADKLMKSLKGKKAMRVLASHRGSSRTASEQPDMALTRSMIRLAYTNPELRSHLLPLVVEHLASMDT